MKNIRINIKNIPQWLKGLGLGVMVGVGIGIWQWQNFGDGVSFEIGLGNKPEKISFIKADPLMVDVMFQTKKPSIGVVLWGYIPENLDYVVLGSGGDEKVKEHSMQIRLDRPVEELYFKVLINGRLFGDEEGKAYKVSSDLGKYQLLEIPLVPQAPEKRRL